MGHKTAEKFDINESNALIFEDDEGRFTLSPRGCLAAALSDVGIGDTDDAIELSKTPKFDMAFRVLVKRFKEHGWIEGNGEPQGTKNEQMEAFSAVVGVYFKGATENEIEAAFDEFVILLERHGNTKKDEN